MSAVDEQARFLTTAQTEILAGLMEAWDGISEPTVLRLSSPMGRGKTHIFQAFAESISHALPPSSQFYGFDIDRVSSRSWRLTRKQVASTQVNLGAPPNAIWIGVNAVKDSSLDILEPLRSQVRASLSHIESTDDPALQSRLSSSFNDGAMAAIRRAAGELAIDSVPFGSAAKTAITASAALYKAWKQRGSLADDFDALLANDAGLTFLHLSAVIRQLADPSRPPALLPTLIVVENAESLDTHSLGNLTSILRVNPDEVFGEKAAALSPHFYRMLKQHGIPPVLPVLVVLLETTTAGQEAVIGPSGATETRSPNEKLILDQWLERWEEKDVRVIDKTLPLMTKVEAEHVCRSLVLKKLTDSQVRLICEHAHDSFLGGVNVALLRSHADKVLALQDPEATVDATWVLKNLPTYLTVDSEQRYLALAPATRSVVSAAALAGIGFSALTVADILNGADASQALQDAARRSLIHRYGDDEGLYCFDDSMQHGVAYREALADQTLCWRALDVAEAPKVRMLASRAFAGVSDVANWVYEATRQALWHYRQLAIESGLSDARRLHRDVWLASLTLHADLDLLRTATGTDAAAKQRLAALGEGQESGPIGDESPLVWSIIHRWHVHRLTPGPMTASSLFKAAQATRLPDGNTRTMPEAHKIAADRAGETLSTSLAQYGALSEHGLRLLCRLGPYGRLFDDGRVNDIVSALVLASARSVTACHLVALEYANRLSGDHRAYVAANLNQVWLFVPDPSVRVRTVLALVRLGHLTDEESIRGILLPALTRYVSDRALDDQFANFDQVGGFLDPSDPLVYPWYGLPVLASQILLEGPPAPFLRGAEKRLILNTLQANAESHPSAVGLLLAHFRRRVSANTVSEWKECRRVWRSTGLVGHFEQAGLPSMDSPPARRR
ncbi:hypothetical protein ACI2KV_18500 [Micromonospora chokoriensis]